MTKLLSRTNEECIALGFALMPLCTPTRVSGDVPASRDAEADTDIEEEGGTYDLASEETLLRERFDAFSDSITLLLALVATDRVKRLMFVNLTAAMSPQLQNENQHLSPDEDASMVSLQRKIEKKPLTVRTRMSTYYWYTRLICKCYKTYDRTIM